MNSYTVNLNFVSLLNTNFEIVCYRRKVLNNAEERPFDGAAQYALPSDNDTEKWVKYWITSDFQSDWEKYSFRAQDNHVAAVWILNKILLPDLEKFILSCDNRYIATIEGEFFPCLKVKLKSHEEGWQGVCLEFKYLKEKKQFGLIVNYHFFVNTEKELLNRRRIQQLSFSFDSNGRSNKNFYIDRYKWESAFLRKILVPYKYNSSDIIPEGLSFNSGFSTLPAFLLSSREYDFGNEGVDSAQYRGLLKYGPLQVPNKMPKFYFVFRKQDKAVAISLYKALAGKTYPSRFPGMEQVFKVPFGRDAIASYELDDFSLSSMKKAASYIKKQGDDNAVCIALTDEDPNIYYAQKASFLNYRIATQNVKIDSVVKSHGFEWFVAGIGLQIFCKAFGHPWKVRTQNHNTIIVGVSQAFSKDENNLKRYVSYSVTTDASGVFKDIQTLADSSSGENYIESLADKLKKKLLQIIKSGSEKVDRVVLHCSFKLPVVAMHQIRVVVEEIANMDNVPQIVILRINTDHEYSGYDVSQASLVPKECSYVSLGGNKYILWCDGVKNDKSVDKRPCAPLHVCFDHAWPKITQADRISILGDVSNLAGANWRGFNASTQPVSVFYCRIVGEFIKEFTERKLPVPSVEEFMPWFL